MPKVSLEKEFREYMKEARIGYKDFCQSWDQLDFLIQPDPNSRIRIDTKEKVQPYLPGSWDFLGDEQDAFVLDDLAARKILGRSPDSGIVIRNSAGCTIDYYFFSIVDLMMIPKRRVDRPIYDKKKHKGKWIISLKDGLKAKNLDGIFDGIRSYLNNKRQIFSQGLSCYGNYPGEQVDKTTNKRHKSYKYTDLGITR